MGVLFFKVHDNLASIFLDLGSHDAAPDDGWEAEVISDNPSEIQ